MKIEGGGGSGTSETTAGNSTNFVLLSEGCVAYILSHTSPRDACIASSISRGLKCSANSDAVWERFLPSDYQDIISRSVSPVIYSSKKELYFRLCDSPVLLDDGNIRWGRNEECIMYYIPKGGSEQQTYEYAMCHKYPTLTMNGDNDDDINRHCQLYIVFYLSFSLNKHNGKKCFMLGAKALSIAWQDTLVFWRWRSLPESRFAKVAELLAVCWLEIKGKVTTRMLSSETSYAAYLVYKIGQISHGLDFPAKTWVRHVGGREEDAGASVVYLTPPKTGEVVQNSMHRHREIAGGVPRRRADGWMEIKLGKFYKEKMDGEVEMEFMETQELHWKSGLIIEGIDIRPATTAAAAAIDGVYDRMNEII